MAAWCSDPAVVAAWCSNTGPRRGRGYRSAMPIYAYRCNTCGQDFEDRRAVADRDGAACPECGGEARRLLAAFAAVGAAPAPPQGCGPSMCAARQAAGMPCSAEAGV